MTAKQVQAARYKRQFAHPAAVASQYLLDLIEVLIFFATVIALPVFIMQGDIRWGPAILLAVGLSLGGWIGAKFAVRGGEKWIRIVMIVAAIALALRLLGFWDWVF